MVFKKVKIPLLGEIDERQVWMRDTLITGKNAAEIQGL